MWKNNIKELSLQENIIINQQYYYLCCVLFKKIVKNHDQWKFLKNQTLWTEIFHQGFQQAVILCYYLLQEENENIISVFEEKEKISNLQFEKEDIIKKY